MRMYLYQFKTLMLSAALAVCLFTPLLFFVSSLIAGVVGKYDEATWLGVMAIFASMTERSKP